MGRDNAFSRSYGGHRNGASMSNPNVRDGAVIHQITDTCGAKVDNGSLELLRFLPAFI